MWSATALTASALCSMCCDTGNDGMEWDLARPCRFLFTERPAIKSQEEHKN